MNKTIIVFSAIASITVLELYALNQGIDGTLLSTIVGIIAGLGGYIVKGQTAKNQS